MCLRGLLRLAPSRSRSRSLQSLDFHSEDWRGALNKPQCPPVRRAVIILTLGASPPGWEESGPVPVLHVRTFQLRLTRSPLGGGHQPEPDAESRDLSSALEDWGQADAERETEAQASKTTPSWGE